MIHPQCRLHPQYAVHPEFTVHLQYIAHPQQLGGAFTLCCSRSDRQYRHSLFNQHTHPPVLSQWDNTAGYGKCIRVIQRNRWYLILKYAKHTGTCLMECGVIGWAAQKEHRATHWPPGSVDLFQMWIIEIHLELHILSISPNTSLWKVNIGLYKILLPDGS